MVKLISGEIHRGLWKAALGREFVEYDILDRAVNKVGTEMTSAISTLYRPVGQAELDLIRASGFRAFPPRLPEQPFFYPVLSEEYATKIARDWNTKDEQSGFAGYVVRFKVRATFLEQFEVHTVGGAEHQEYWIPAAELPRLNDNIVGQIETVQEFCAAR